MDPAAMRREAAGHSQSKLEEEEKGGERTRDR